jgi:hypothetical protein
MDEGSIPSRGSTSQSNTTGNRMTLCDIEYREIIREIVHRGDFVESRNAPVKSLIDCRQIVFRETPLVTWRKTAWKKAIREMSWFMSGNSLCPDELRDWWDGQLNREGRYIGGYGDQLRSLLGRSHGRQRFRSGQIPARRIARSQELSQARHLDVEHEGHVGDHELQRQSENSDELPRIYYPMPRSR